jgi:ubiquinone/menaquinone biosynthesis C-methylase UbiE
MDWGRLLPDEVGFAGDEHLDPGYVAAYDAKAAFDPTDDVALLRRHGLGSESTLVDFGGGTGTFALAAAPHCRRVVVVDVSAAMIAAARQHADRLGVANVEYVQSGFLRYEHEGDPADFVYSRNALHHLPDFWKAIALERIAQMLRPGGYLRLRDLVFAFDPAEAGEVIGAWLGAAANRSEDGWTRSELETHLRDEHSTFNWVLEPMLERAGFVIEEAEYGPERVFASYRCVKLVEDSR